MIRKLYERSLVFFDFHDLISCGIYEAATTIHRKKLTMALTLISVGDIIF